MNKTVRILHEILGTSTKIALWVKIIAILLFLLSSFVSFHYIFCNFPTKVERDSLTFDYVGLLVGFYGALVTLLVGWQIYSTINAKKEVRTLTKRYGHSIHKSSRDVKNCNAEIETLRKLITSEIERIDQQPVLVALFNSAKQLEETGLIENAIITYAMVAAYPYDYAYIQQSGRNIARLLINNKTKVNRAEIYAKLNELYKQIKDNADSVINTADVEIIRQYINLEGAFA